MQLPHNIHTWVQNVLQVFQYYGIPMNVQYPKHYISRFVTQFTLLQAKTLIQQMRTLHSTITTNYFHKSIDVSTLHLWLNVGFKSRWVPFSYQKDCVSFTVTNACHQPWRQWNTRFCTVLDSHILWISTIFYFPI